MRNYELTLLLKAGQTEAELHQLLGEVASLLGDAGGLIMAQNSKGKRTLISPIKNRQEAELAVLKFTLDPQKVEGVEKELKAKESILRFALLSFLPRKAKSLTVAKTVATPAPQEPTEEEKVEIGDIDKKLEEIFRDNI